MAPAVQQDQQPLDIDKQPIKWMELPIMKFNDVAVPHHVNRLKTLKTNIQKCQRAGDWIGAHREQMNANVVVKQLRTLVKEMDKLRSQVIDTDVHKFDKMINDSRQSALKILQEFIDLSHQLPPLPDDNHYCRCSNSDNTGEHRNRVCGNCKASCDDNDVLQSERLVGGESQYQLQQTLDISRLSVECQEQERCAAAWEKLQKDIEEVQQLYEELASIVQTQGESVTRIETNVQVTEEKVEEGEKELLKSARLKMASYPFTGAVIGSFMGGPVGVVAGFKMGSIVALTCSILGFTGGKLLKRKQTSQQEEPHQHTL